MAVAVARLPHPVTLEGMTVEEAPGGTIAGFAGDRDVSAAVNGRLVPVEDWRRPLPDGAVLVLRARVGDDDTDPLRTVLQVALIVAAVYTGQLQTLGPLAKAFAVAAITVGGNLIINAIAPPRLPGADGDREGPETLYSLTGGANRARPYQPMLLVLGTHRVFPDIGAAPYATFESRAAAGGATADYTVPEDPAAPYGYDRPNSPPAPARATGGATDQYLHQIFHFGLGDLRIEELRIADTLLTDFDEVQTQFAGADGALTLVAGNVDTEAGAALEDVAWVARQTAADTNRIGLDFVGQIFQVSEGGDLQRHSVAVLVEMWPDGDEAAKRSFTLTLAHAEASPYRASFAYDLEPAGVWHVRVRRQAGPDASERVRDDVSWTALRAHQPDTADYRGQNRMAARIRASGQLQGRLDRVSGMASQLIPAWDGGAWVDAQVSSNPAWLFRWYARGVRENGELQAGVGLGAASVDDALLKLWGAWCDSHGLTCNFVIDRDMSHAEVLALIAQCGRASPSWATGRLGVVWDAEDEPPSFFFGPGNIELGSMQVDWVSGAIAEEVVIRYRDPDLDWQFNTVRRRVPGVMAADRTATLTRPAVTSREQAAKECNLQAARQLYHRRRLRWRTGPEGLSVARGKVGYLSHALVDGGVTGRVLAGSRDALTLTRPVALPAAPAPDRGDDHLLLRLPDGALHQSVIGRAAGSEDPDETDRVTLATPLPQDLDAGGSAPTDTVWRHYLEDAPPIKVKIVGVEPDVDGGVSFEAIDEIAAYYDAATSDLTVDLPTLRREHPRVTAINVSEDLLRAGGGYAVQITAAITVEGDWRGGVVTSALDGGPERVVAELREGNLQGSWIVPLSGTLLIRAIPGSRAAPAGDSAETTHAIRGFLVGPDAPSGLAATPLAGGYSLKWERPENADFAYTEVFESADTSAAEPPPGDAPVAAVTGDGALRLGLAGADELRVWARHVDQRGNPGPTARVDVTPLPAAVSYRETAIYRSIGLQDDAPDAPANPTWDGSDIGGIPGWSEDFPVGYDPNTHKVACAILLLGSDDSASVLGSVRICESPGDINAVFARSVNKPDRLADSEVRRPAGTYDTHGDVPAGAGVIWLAVGNRPPNGTEWTWSEWAILEGQFGYMGVGNTLVYNGRKSAVSQVGDPGDYFIGQSLTETVFAGPPVNTDDAGRWAEVLHDTTVFALTDRDDDNVKRYYRDVLDVGDRVGIYIGPEQWAEWSVSQALSYGTYDFTNAGGRRVTREYVVIHVGDLIASATPPDPDDVEFPDSDEDIRFDFSRAAPGPPANDADFVAV